MWLRATGFAHGALRDGQPERLSGAGLGPVPPTPDDAWSPGLSGNPPASSLALILMAFTAPVAPASTPIIEAAGRC